MNSSFCYISKVFLLLSREINEISGSLKSLIFWSWPNVKCPIPILLTWPLSVHFLFAALGFWQYKTPRTSVLVHQGKDECLLDRVVVVKYQTLITPPLSESKPLHCFTMQEGAQWASRPKLRIFNKKIFFTKQLIIFQF